MSRRGGTGNNGRLQATFVKKCSAEYHRPETNRQCASGTCQHTCQPSEIARCRHAWTVRYNVNGVQRDKSFRDEMDGQKRVQYGTGLRKAQDFQLELTRGKRAQGKTCIDPKAGNAKFEEAAETYIANQPVAERTRELLRCVYRNHVKPVSGAKGALRALTATDGRPSPNESPTVPCF
jgi:hypothetical protein